MRSSDARRRFIDTRGKPAPFGNIVTGPLPEAERHARAAALAPVIRGLASTDRPQLGHYSDHPAVLEFTGSEKLAALAALGTSCPDHFLRTKVRPMVLDLPPDAPLDEVTARLRELHRAYRAGYQAYYERYATPDSPPMRGADPAIVLVPGVGMFSFGADKQTARVAGEFYLNAINVMRGAEAISAYAPSPKARSSASSTGSSRRPSCAAAPSPGPCKAGSPWSPAAAPASAGPPRGASPPRGPASSSPTATRRRPRPSRRPSALVNCGRRRGHRGRR